MKAIILLAGYATRMYPLTQNYPKALLPIKGKPILDYIVDQINTIPEIDEIFAVTNDRFYNTFMDWMSVTPSMNPIRVINDGSVDNESRIGAIGDILHVLTTSGKIDDDYYVVAGDSYFTFDLKEQYNLFKEKGYDNVAVLEVDDINKLRSCGVAQLSDDGVIIDMEEKPENPKSNLIAYASYFYGKRTMALFSQYLLEGNSPDAPGNFVAWLYKRQPVFGYMVNGEFHDIGTIEMYKEMK